MDTAAADGNAATKQGAIPTISTSEYVHDDGSVDLPDVTLPYSALASVESKQNFLELARFFSAPADKKQAGDIKAARKQLDDRIMRPGLERLRQVFPVHIRSEMIGGVRTDIIDPVGGIADKNKHRVLVNLHGGGFLAGGGLGGQMESVPIASLGAIQVITVDYRHAPEHTFPAASEDAEAVYRELLKRNHAPRNIGIYGCSAGGMLTAQVAARFVKRGLPLPGAIGMLGAGAVVPVRGDSAVIGHMLNGQQRVIMDDSQRLSPYFRVADLDVRDPLVSPAYSPDVLAKFPPSLLISGTRDFGLSAVVYTHAQLTKQHVNAHLHVWEGASHCSFAQPFVDPNVPETREAWDVILRFFDQYLGT
jgi:monoterpene epsilon-lactone hydrolase